MAIGDEALKILGDDIAGDSMSADVGKMFSTTWFWMTLPDTKCLSLADKKILDAIWRDEVARRASYF